MPTWLLHLVLALLMVGVPASARFESIELDEDHEKDRSKTTKEQATRKRVAQLPRRTPRVTERPRIEPGNDPGFVPTMHSRVPEIARLGAAERRML